ncbi:tyrosine-type recombinase/integrase [Streptantibioticus silvisoli]|uniref:Tyrosine-type recombinase/integrase n=1 Tax=Streptantibioticus silvisoli TaxID=2705255 RepID=A0ABT6W684_9ACTN|nr:tyrosine-type recombinase/integrase [Streptantibioticus silvisoli]MDI5966189.1 tyrosine-type recombinase/integrase [Streptantibioticus silvisoli]
MAHAEKRWSEKDKRWYWRVKYKLPNGKWGSASKDDYGNRFTSERAAEKYGSACETDVDRKVFINPRDGKIAIGEWSARWIESLEVGNRSEETYRQRLRSVILPYWRDVPVGDVLTISYVTWEKSLKDRYSHEYVKSVRSVFRTMMDDAVTSKLRADNPVPNRQARRRGKYQGKPREDTTVLATPRQALLLARNGRQLRGLTGYVMPLTIAYMGLRISEMVGLRRDHLLLEDRGEGARLLLQEQHQYVNGKSAQVDPKYGSTGSLIIPPFLVDLLRELLESHSSDWVFTNTQGGQLSTKAAFYKRVWRPMVDGREKVATTVKRTDLLPGLRAVADVEDIVPHGLRHSQKVWLDEAGHPKVAVETRMRHVIPGVEGTYSHVTLGMELKIAETLERLWAESQRVVVDRREYEPPRSPRSIPRSSQ